MCKRLILRSWQMPSTKLGSYLVIASLVGWAVVLGGFGTRGCGGASTTEPDDSTKKVDTLRIDAVYQVINQTRFNAFQEGACKKTPTDVFAGCNLYLRFASDTPYYNNKPTIVESDREYLWDTAHPRKLYYPALVLSVRNYGDSSQYGVVLTESDIPRCNKRDLVTQKNLVLLVCKTMTVFDVMFNAPVSRTPAIWGFTHTHELGHLYSCLKDMNDDSFNHNDLRCLMQDFNELEAGTIRNILNETIFCDSCKSCIKVAVGR